MVFGLIQFRDGSGKGTASVQTILCDDTTFLSRVIAGDESWIYGYDPETKKQFPQWESPNSPRPKMARQANSKMKHMLVIFFAIKGIIHKEFVLVGQAVKSAYYCDVYSDCVKCAKNSP
jgi:hypothetical protein